MHIYFRAQWPFWFSWVTSESKNWFNCQGEHIYAWNPLIWWGKTMVSCQQQLEPTQWQKSSQLPNRRPSFRHHFLQPCPGKCHCRTSIWKHWPILHSTAKTKGCMFAHVLPIFSSFAQCWHFFQPILISQAPPLELGRLEPVASRWLPFSSKYTKRTKRH